MALGQFRRQGDFGHVPPADRELEEALQRAVLDVPCSGDGPGAGQELGYGFKPNPNDRSSQPDGAAEGVKDVFGPVEPLAHRPAKINIVRDQITDVHSRPSRLKSATVRSAAKSTLA